MVDMSEINKRDTSKCANDYYIFDMEICSRKAVKEQVEC